MLYFGRVGSLLGLCAKVGSSWGEMIITPNFNNNFGSDLIAVTFLVKSIERFS
jgi:hypothetical protein